MPSLRGSFSNDQREILRRPVLSQRVSTTQGMAYLEAHDIIAHLSRIFGFEGWDKEVLFCDLLFETGDLDLAKPKWTVAYKAGVRLTVYDPEGIVCTIKEDVSGGEAINQPSRADAHDLAMKSAVSTALKRAAKDLGDQFGLSLYDKGSLAASIRKVVPYEDPSDAQLPLD